MNTDILLSSTTDPIQVSQIIPIIYFVAKEFYKRSRAAFSLSSLFSFHRFGKIPQSSLYIHDPDTFAD